jgi:RNA 2',3'-cyclic 3'-phosphodiesterase
MPEGDSLGERDRLRLFCAVRLPDSTIERLASWQQRELASLERIRVLSRDHLHITLAFLGSRPAPDVDRVVCALREVASTAGRPLLRAQRYRETQRVAMVVLAEQEPRYADRLAGQLHLLLEELGVYRRELRSWLPHVTVARFQRPPRLQPPLPDLGTFSPSEVALYHSLLRPSGAQYEVLESIALGG